MWPIKTFVPLCLSSRTIQLAVLLLTQKLVKVWQCSGCAYLTYIVCECTMYIEPLKKLALKEHYSLFWVNMGIWNWWQVLGHDLPPSSNWLVWWMAAQCTDDFRVNCWTLRESQSSWAQSRLLLNKKNSFSHPFQLKF